VLTSSTDWKSKWSHASSLSLCLHSADSDSFTFHFFNRSLGEKSSESSIFNILHNPFVSNHRATQNWFCDGRTSYSLLFEDFSILIVLPLLLVLALNCVAITAGVGNRI
jgi:hypothetical protein